MRPIDEEVNLAVTQAVMKVKMAEFSHELQHPQWPQQARESQQ